MTREARFWGSLLKLADLVAITLAWMLAHWLRFRSGWIELPEGNVIHPIRIYLAPAVLSLVIFLWAFSRQNAYQLHPGSWLQDARSVLRGLFLGAPLLVMLTYLAYRDLYSRGVLILFIPLSFAMVVLMRSSARLVLSRWLASSLARRKVVAICGGKQSREVLTEYLRSHPDAELVRRLELEQAGDLDIAGAGADEVLIIFSQLESGWLERILQGLESELIDIKLIPNWSSFRLLGYEIEKAGRFPLIHLRRSPLYGWGRLIKRVVDITMSLLGILVTTPLQLLIGVLIWVTSGWPILYSQQRVGFDGRTFRMYKFRSMIHGAERKSVSGWTQPDDPRRTRLGALLRRLNLDELPQLYNILRGDMSFVGPRPEMAHLIEDFKRRIPDYYLRHKVKAGLTGWAQIHGLRGNTSLEERIKYDLYYIENWSLGLDLKILALTLVRGWSNAY